jgi:DNA-binding NtrC family response regulator
MPAVFRSPLMLALLARVQRVAMSNAAVLITGESGSGKELIARAIHHWSLRCTKPWVDVNCAALPEQLVESELFGYEKGAFSGAATAKPGLFELAAGGTLFLDEIGELETRIQVKLLRVLDQVPYYRLGGTRKITADVRIVAATNKDLPAACKQGLFRSDLYHRLSQVHIAVPPLRERREDILPLAEFFLQQQNSQLRLSERAMEELHSYSWPGNVRELRNTMIRAAVEAEGEVIDTIGLGGGTEAREIQVRHDGAQGVIRMDEAERELIFRALAESGGHQQRAAERLGISRRTLSRKLKLYRQLNWQMQRVSA